MTSYLHEMWPVLTLMRVLGWLPAQRRHDDTDTLELRMRSRLYCAVVLTVQLVPAIYLTFKGLTLVPYLDPKLHLVSYVQLMCGVLGPQLMPVFVAMQAPLHVNFCNMLRHFQVRLESVSASQRALQFGLRGLAWASLVMYVVPFATIMVLRPLVLWEMPSWTLDLFLSLSLGNISLLLGWWILAMRAVQVASQRLVQEFSLLQVYNEDGGRGGHVARLVLSMRPLWLQLCAIVRRSGEALSLAQSLLMFIAFTILLYVLYSLLSPQSVETTILLVFFLTTSASIIYIMCLCAQNAREQVRLDFVQCMDITRKLRVSSKTKDEMLTIFIHLSQRSPEVTFRGYITVGRGLVSTLVAALVTNLMVLYQLQITERRLDARDFFTFGDDNSL